MPLSEPEESISKKNNVISNEKNDDKKLENEPFISKELEEFLEDAPPNVKKQIQLSIMSSMQSGLTSPILDKFKSEHIDKVLDYNENDSERNYNYAKRTQNYNLLYILIAASLFIFLTIFLSKDDPQTYKDIISYSLTFLAGTGAGFGLKTYIDSKKRSN